MNQTNKGTFLTEFYGVTDIPALVDGEGNPTKFAEAAGYWGEEIPKTEVDVKRLVAKGQLLSATNDLTETQKFSNSSTYGGKQLLSLLRNNKIKVPFVKKGAWKHDAYGEVKFTDEDFNQLIQNYKNNVVGFTPYLTLGHIDEEPNSTDSHRKRGDLTDIVVEGDVGYGIFEVPDDIYASVERGEYEYSSGEFNRQFTSKETGDKVGTAVIRVALTNSPFLPFGEDKIQTLSDDAESCPESKESCVFLLSIDAPKQEISEGRSDTTEVKPEVEVKAAETEDINTINNLSHTETIMDKTQVTPAVEETKVAVTEEVVTEAQELSTEAAKEVAAPAAVMSEPAPKVEEAKQSNIAEAALANLTSQLQKVEELYKTQLEAANKTITDLVSKVEGLTSKLNSQEEVTQAFSTSMSQAAERQMVQHLQNNNVSPALVNKFIAFKNGLTENNTVKLSVTAGEETKEMEYGVVDSVAELLIAASNQAPIVEQQLGVSAGRKAGAFDFSGIIQRNTEAAKKTTV